MQNYVVQIEETLGLTVEVEAESSEKAVEIVSKRHDDHYYEVTIITGVSITVVFCKECEHTGDDLCPVNLNFKDEFQTCPSCHDSMLDRNEFTMCASCGAYFTYNHLIPNKDSDDNQREICPYCGEVWCE